MEGLSRDFTFLWTRGGFRPVGGNRALAAVDRGALGVHNASLTKLLAVMSLELTRSWRWLVL